MKMLLLDKEPIFEKQRRLGFPETFGLNDNGNSDEENVMDLYRRPNLRRGGEDKGKRSAGDKIDVSSCWLTKMGGRVRHRGSVR